MATWPTSSGRTRWPCWRPGTASRSTSPSRSAPWTSATPDGDAIPIEERAAKEVLFVRGVPIAPTETEVRNPSFDVTPAELITGIVTDEGVIRAPYGDGLAAAVARRELRRSQSPGFRAISKPATVPAADAPAGVATPNADASTADARADVPTADVPAVVES